MSTTRDFIRGSAVRARRDFSNSANAFGASTAKQKRFAVGSATLLSAPFSCLERCSGNEQTRILLAIPGKLEKFKLLHLIVSTESLLGAVRFFLFASAPIDRTWRCTE